MNICRRPIGACRKNTRLTGLRDAAMLALMTIECEISKVKQHTNNSEHTHVCVITQTVFDAFIRDIPTPWRVSKHWPALITRRRCRGTGQRWECPATMP